MSQLTDFQPTIFYGTCTLKGLIWLSWYFVPELFHASKKAEEDVDDEEWAMTGSGSTADSLSALLVVQDHHVLMWERICHYTNILALFSIILYYSFNPRLWQYKYWGWFLLALLLFQHLPQQLLHEMGGGFASSTPSKPERHYSIADDDIFEPEEDPTATATATTPTQTITALDIIQTNRIFSTIGVVVTQLYFVVGGYATIFKRFTAEPMFVFSTLITILMETHINFLSVWLLPLISPKENYHISGVLPKWFRLLLCFTAISGLAVAIKYQQQFHKQQSKILYKQLRTINTKPKMKFV